MKNFYRAPLSNGFTLVELLVVITIILILSAVSVPAISSILGAGAFNNALVQISGEMELAQEYALSNNTYSYVGFTEPNAQGQTFMAIFGAQDGSTGGVSDVSTASGTIASGLPPTTPPVTGDGSLYILSRVVTLQGVAFDDPPSIPTSVLSNPRNTSLVTGGSVVFLSNSDGSFSYNYLGTALKFDRVVQFTPAGEVRVGLYVPSAVQLVLAPTVGHSSSLVVNSASVVQVAGITGQVTTYRP